MNTTLHYFYRDTHNFKQIGTVTFSGAITPEQTARFRAHLLQAHYLVPEQIRVPDLLGLMDKQYEDDAPWRHEFHRFITTQDAPDDPRTITEFIDQVTATQWNADPGFGDLAAMTHSHQADLADFLDLVRARVRRAARVELQTSDQGTYGFVLHDVVLSTRERISDTDPRLLSVLQDEGWPYLTNIDWNGIVGEDEHGHAVINL